MKFIQINVLIYTLILNCYSTPTGGSIEERIVFASFVFSFALHFNSISLTVVEIM